VEEATLAGCGGLLQLARCGDLNDTSRGNRDSRVAVGARRAKAERHSFDASRDGLHIEPPDLAGVVRPPENPGKTGERFAGIPSAYRGCGRSLCRSDGTPGRLSQRSEWTWIEALPSGYARRLIGLLTGCLDAAAEPAEQKSERCLG
jgi:hypothetical protein